MVKCRKQHSFESRAKQASNEIYSAPNKIGASAPYALLPEILLPMVASYLWPQCSRRSDFRISSREVSVAD